MFHWVTRLQNNLVPELMGYSVTGLLHCINVRLLRLFGYLVTTYLGTWLPGYWATGLLGY